MLNHAYTILLNKSSVVLLQDVRLIDPDFSPIRIPTALNPIQQALYADCSTDIKCEQRAEAWLSLLVTPEVLPYTLKFDSRNTYAGRSSTLLDMCTTQAPIAITADRITTLMTSVRQCPGLFTLPVYADDMQLFHRLHYTAPDRYLSLAGVLLAYTYQLEVLRTS